MGPHAGHPVRREHFGGRRHGERIHAGTGGRKRLHGGARRTSPKAAAAACAARDRNRHVCPVAALDRAFFDAGHRCVGGISLAAAMARAPGARGAPDADAAGCGDGRRVSVAGAGLRAPRRVHRRRVWQQYDRRGGRCSSAAAAVARGRLDECGPRGRCAQPDRGVRVLHAGSARAGRAPGAGRAPRRRGGGTRGGCRTTAIRSLAVELRCHRCRELAARDGLAAAVQPRHAAHRIRARADPRGHVARHGSGEPHRSAPTGCKGARGAALVRIGLRARRSLAAAARLGVDRAREV